MTKKPGITPLANYMKRRGISAREFAKSLEPRRHHSTISLIARGAYDPPKKMIDAIAKATRGEIAYRHWLAYWGTEESRGRRT